LDCNPESIVARSEELLKKWKALRKAKSKGVFKEDDMQLTSTGNSKTTDESLEFLIKFFNTSTDLLISKVEKLKDEWDQMKEEIALVSKIVGEENIQNLIESAEMEDNWVSTCLNFSNNCSVAFPAVKLKRTTPS